MVKEDAIRFIEKNLGLKRFSGWKQTDRIEYTASLNAYLKFTDHKVFLVGQFDTPVKISCADWNARSDAVRLPVGCVMRLFGFPAHLITGQCIELGSLQDESVFFKSGTSVSRLRETLYQQSDEIISERSVMDMLLEYLLSRQTATVAEMSRISGYSERQLRRLVSEYTGFSPKVFLELLRFFKTSLHLESLDAHLNLADIAVLFGYYDQPHLNKQFRRFADCTPESYRIRMSGFYNT